MHRTLSNITEGRAWVVVCTLVANSSVTFNLLLARTCSTSCSYLLYFILVLALHVHTCSTYSYLLYMFLLALHIPTCFTCSFTCSTCSYLLYMFLLALHVPICSTCSYLLYMFLLALHVPTCSTCPYVLYMFYFLLILALLLDHTCSTSCSSYLLLLIFPLVPTNTSSSFHV